MWRRLILLALGLSMASALVGGGTQARAGGNGAEVVNEKDGTCLAKDNAGSSWFFTCTVHIVFTRGGAINHQLTGSVIADGSSPLPSQPVTDFTGQPCFVLFGEVLTRVTSGVLTPSGQVQLTCRS
jgi:hypothetical protein